MIETLGQFSNSSEEWNPSILEEIAATIESQPVLGHWPTMRAAADANYLRLLANALTEFEDRQYRAENCEKHGPYRFSGSARGCPVCERDSQADGEGNGP